MLLQLTEEEFDDKIKLSTVRVSVYPLILKLYLLVFYYRMNFC